MTRFKKRKVLYAVLSIICIHLVSVCIWASVYSDRLIGFYDKNAHVALSVENREILLHVEDPTFESHIGVDLSNGQGLTTITSSVSRQIFYSGLQLNGFGGGLQRFYSAIFNCCKRIDLGRDLMAIILNSKLSKDRQLSIYLSTVYMGGFKGIQAIGFEAASLIYYAKPLDQLNINEFIGLTAMPLSPNYYHPFKNPVQHNERVKGLKKLVSGKCRAQGWFDLEYPSCATEA
jgi:hypothetical protein